jgi:intracellular multiplication protein IcmG
MADNDQNNDEYKFAELDSPEGDSLGDSEHGSSDSGFKGGGHDSERKNIKRNALIVVGVMVLAMVMYKLVGMMFSGKTNSTQTTTSIPPLTQTAAKPAPKVIVPTPPPPAPVVEPIQPIANTGDADLKQKVSAIEQSQQTVKAEVTSVGEQVGTVNTNVNNLNTQIAKLNQVIENLSIQVSKQSQEINVLRTCTQPKPVKKVIYHHVRRIHKRMVYYIQAVIPGRAWLIGSNGSTLTVREGTKVAGYGVVKLIDSMQGRILTSSGQVIKFSQEDS